jgi:pyruvate/2-oxoglutarate dehydrogenase complex dihydrolipoamide acyltransferase (E2) component
MMSFAARPRMGLALTLAVLSAACSNTPSPKIAAGAAQPLAASEAEAIAGLLDQGERAQAGKRLKSALKHDPHNPSLMLLRDSMERDPQELLGPRHFSYTVRPGDTIGGLAQRFLGNRLKSHQLARYNDIAGASLLQSGQTLRIPGQAPRSEPSRPERQAAPQSAPAPRAKAAPAPRAAEAAAPAAQQRVDAAAAQRARSAGLAALNEGQPARAVGLLSRAAALDPGNAAIARDLQRAQRISATVQARQ